MNPYEDLFNATLNCFQKHGNHEQRQWIRAHLEDTRFQEACLQICNSDHSVSIRRWAHEAAAQMKGAAFFELTRQALSDKAMTIRLHTLIGIAASKEEERVEWLFHLLDDSYGSIRLNALEILIEKRHDVLAPCLARLREDPKTYVRKRVLALG